MFMATSRDKMVSEQFCRRAHLAGNRPVMWYIELDKKYKCMHVNLVESSNVAKEAEFLFVPYSTFTVKRVVWETKPTWLKPHQIYLEAAIDNICEDEDLPLAPWS